MKNTNIKAHISFFGDKFILEDLSKILKLKPTYTHQKGDKSLLNPKAPPKKEICWRYLVGPIETYYIEDVLDPIIDLLKDKLELLKDFIERNNLSVKISIVPIVENNLTPALYFNHRTIKIISEISAEIDIDLYVN